LVIDLLISRECDYAIRVIRSLSTFERMSIQQICKQEYIPHAYAYKIIKKLEQAHLVNIFRGAKGGYELACDLEQTTLYDIYQAIEGDLLLNDCQRPGSECPNRNGGKRCKVHAALESLQEQFIQIMKLQLIRTII